MDLEKRFFVVSIEETKITVTPHLTIDTAEKEYSRTWIEDCGIIEHTAEKGFRTLQMKGNCFEQVNSCVVFGNLLLKEFSKNLKEFYLGKEERYFVFQFTPQKLKFWTSNSYESAEKTYSSLNFFRGSAFLGINNKFNVEQYKVYGTPKVSDCVRLMKIFAATALLNDYRTFCSPKRKILGGVLNLIVFVHGMNGDRSDWMHWIEAFKAERDYFLYVSKTNENKGTHEGIATCGTRFATELILFIERLSKKVEFVEEEKEENEKLSKEETEGEKENEEDDEKLNEKKTLTREKPKGKIRLTIISHSFGGLISRYGITVLNTTYKSSMKFHGVQPFMYVAMASPHLGVRKPGGIVGGSLSLFLSVGGYGKSGKEMNLSDEENMLENMAKKESKFGTALDLFESKVLIGLTHHDISVPYQSALIKVANHHPKTKPIGFSIRGVHGFDKGDYVFSYCKEKGFEVFTEDLPLMEEDYKDLGEGKISDKNETLLISKVMLDELQSVEWKRLECEFPCGTELNKLLQQVHWCYIGKGSLFGEIKEQKNSSLEFINFMKELIKKEHDIVIKI